MSEERDALTTDAPGRRKFGYRIWGSSSSGFTLVELILVMALLTIVISVASPNLSQFFRGRSLDLEAGRVLALTRYGQNRAVSSGSPMVLWFHFVEGTYGLREEVKFNTANVGLRYPVELQPSLDRFNEEMPLEYQLAKDLHFELEGRDRTTNNVAIIRFYADGTIDENSLKILFIKDKDGHEVPLMLTRTRMKYEIADRTNLWAGAFR